MSQPIVADQLREGPASRGRRIRAVIFGRRRVAEHHDGARGSLGRDTQDLFCLGLLFVIAEPGRTAAKPDFTVPMSVIDEDSEVYTPGTEGTLIIPMWMAIEKNLV